MTDRLDADRFANAVSAALIACLIPREPLAGNAYLSASIIAFATVAFANHLSPKRLHRLTHVAKAAYTHVLVASIARSWQTLPLWLAVATVVSAVDLLPLRLRSPRLRAASEAVGAWARWSAILYGFWLMAFPPWLIALFGVCSAAYYRERRARIATGARHEYGLAHSLEHLAVWVYLLTLNAGRLNLPLVWRSTLALLGLAALFLVLAGVWTNLTALRRLRREVPEWFDPELRPFVLRKCRDNALSHRWQHYLIKPFTPMVSSRRVTWHDIEAMVQRIELRQRFDAVVGVLSGGAFITRLVAERNGIGAVHYARSRLWSKLSLLGNLGTSLRYYRGLPNGTEAGFLDDEPDLSGQRVLVVDDSVCTGATLASVRALCRERGASEVRTLSLFCHPRHPSDYFYLHARAPLVWPWGWEAD